MKIITITGKNGIERCKNCGNQRNMSGGGSETTEITNDHDR